MTELETEQGKIWVVSTLILLSESLSVPLESFGWRRQIYARLTDPYLLVLGIDGGEIFLVLSALDLNVCQSDPVVQSRLRRRLKGLLQSLGRESCRRASV